MDTNECCSGYMSLDWGSAPLQAMEILKDTIRKHGVLRQANAGEKIEGEAFLKHVFLVERGIFLLRPDRMHSIGNFGSGKIVGVSNILSDNLADHYLEVQEDVRYIACSIEHFSQHLDDGKLALAIAEYLNWQALMMSFYVSVILKEDAYGKVKFALRLLSGASTNFRDNVSVVKFVCERTGVSKAHAHSILKQLRVGGYIEMASGNLVRIFKSLPEAY